MTAMDPVDQCGELYENLLLNVQGGVHIHIGIGRLTRIDQSDIVDSVGIWQLSQYLWCRFIPPLCLLTVLWPLQWPISLLPNYYCLAIV
jgi:hypothetical protein